MPERPAFITIVRPELKRGAGGLARTASPSGSSRHFALHRPTTGCLRVSKRGPFCPHVDTGLMLVTRLDPRRKRPRVDLGFYSAAASHLRAQRPTHRPDSLIFSNPPRRFRRARSALTAATRPASLRRLHGRSWRLPAWQSSPRIGHRVAGSATSRSPLARRLSTRPRMYICCFDELSYNRLRFVAMLIKVDQHTPSIPVPEFSEITATKFDRK